jgi:hypothetical protein
MPRPLYPRETPLVRWLGLKRRSAGCTEDKELLLLPGIESPFLGYRARSPVDIPTQLSCPVLWAHILHISTPLRWPVMHIIQTKPSEIQAKRAGIPSM